MASLIACRECNYEFAAPKRASSKPVKCPVCGAAATAGSGGIASEPPRAGGGTRCPGCKKVIPAGTKYCVTCDMHVFVPFGELEANAEAVGRANHVAGLVGLAAKTVHVFFCIITLRWGRIFD